MRPLKRKVTMTTLIVLQQQKKYSKNLNREKQ
jgi:hypothetical protein